MLLYAARKIFIDIFVCQTIEYGISYLYLSSFLYWNPASFSFGSLVISGSWTVTVFFCSFSLFPSSLFMSPS